MAEQLTGVWRLRSSSVVAQSTGARSEAWGADASGILILDASGRMVALITRAGRVTAASEPEKATLFQTMLSYSGRYVVEDDRIITSVDLCWEPSWVGTEQTRFYTLQGDVLSLSTPPMPHPAVAGETMVGQLEWTREDS